MLKRVRRPGTDPIPVTAEVFEGIEAVRQSGLTNMLDRPVVARIAAEMDYMDAAEWVDQNRGPYSKGIFQGFVVVPE